MREKIAVIGAGSWGTALAIILAKKGYNINLWVRNQEYLEKIKELNHNVEYLPNIELHQNIDLFSNIKECIRECHYIVVSVPSHSMREIIRRIKDHLNKSCILISTSKGLEIETQKRMSEVIRDEIDEEYYYNVAVLSGPSHAEEVSKNLPTTVTIASDSKSIAEKVQDIFITQKLRVYTNPDLIGVELGGAFKNIIALGAGISDGLGFGDNTKAALMTRGIAEIARLGVAMGADPLTFAGLSGFGDLIVTCTSKHSRNWRAGYEIGKGKNVDEVSNKMKMVIEGVKTTKAAYLLQNKYKIEMPITSEIYNVIFENKDPAQGVEDLMKRVRTKEIEEIAKGIEWKID